MQEEHVVLEIPEQNPDSAEEQEWQPPVLKKAEIPEKKQSCTDVFFIQYVVCIILLTILFSVRLWDGQSFQNAVDLFADRTHADSLPWVLDALEWVKQLWN